jgi:hypothetical protein
MEENTPLLVGSRANVDSNLQEEQNELYNRFSAKEKRAILAVVSWAGLIPRTPDLSLRLGIAIADERH